MAAAPVHSTVLVRGAISATVGVVVGAWVSILLDVWAGVLAGWGATALVGALSALVLTWPMDAAQTRAHARSEDPGRAAARIVSLACSLASLVAVGVVLIQTGLVPEVESWLLAAIAVVAVAASWLLIQTDYMLRLAAVYYSDPVGGIDFNQDEDPQYTDFAYVAFGLGMTYQVADTNIRTNELRRVVLFQTLLAYLFGAIILATVINLVSDLG